MVVKAVRVTRSPVVKIASSYEIPFARYSRGISSVENLIREDSSFPLKLRKIRPEYRHGPYSVHDFTGMMPI